MKHDSGGFERTSLLHSVTLDPVLCKGCTTCVKRCPTEAIRIRSSKAVINELRCIDCGECIRRCPYKAKKALTDHLEKIKDYDYCVALPAPSFFGQFDSKYSIEDIIAGLCDLGFDDAFEVAVAAGLAAQASKDYLSAHSGTKPLISSSCPAIVRLIQVRFPSLLANLIPVLAPMEIAARLARKAIVNKRPDLRKKRVGMFFISPCAAKMTDLHDPIGIQVSALDGVIAFKDIWLLVRAELGKARVQRQNADLSQVTRHTPRLLSAGLAWGRTDGEGQSMGVKKRISVDGIDQVVKILEMAENGSLKDTEFIEAMACPAGCVGGPLVVENPYVAKVRLLNLEEDTLFPAENCSILDPLLDIHDTYAKLQWTCLPTEREGLRLADDRTEALRRTVLIEEISARLPGLDCGSCGAPTCRALAEDCSKGEAQETDCLLRLRQS